MIAIVVISVQLLVLLYLGLTLGKLILKGRQGVPKKRTGYYYWQNPADPSGKSDKYEIWEEEI